MKFASAVLALTAVASVVAQPVENAEIRRLVQTMSQSNLRNIRNVNFNLDALAGMGEAYSSQEQQPQAFSSQEEQPQAFESSNQWMSQSDEQPQPFSSSSDMNMASPWSSQSEDKPAWSAREEKPAWSAREEDSSSEESHGKKIRAPEGRVTSRVASPLMTAPRTLDAQELPVQTQSFKVPLTKNHVENVEQPILQRVVQPYQQRIVRQPQPRVQPYTTRVIQPVIHQEVQPMLSTVIETAEPLPYEFLSTIQNADVTLAPRTSSTIKPLVSTSPRTVGKKSH